MTFLKLNFLYNSKFSFNLIKNSFRFKLFNLLNIYIYLYLFYFLLQKNKDKYKVKLFVFKKKNKKLTYLRSPNNNKLALVKITSTNYKFIISILFNFFINLRYISTLLFFDTNLFYNYKINYNLKYLLLFLYCGYFIFRYQFFSYNIITNIFVMNLLF